MVSARQLQGASVSSVSTSGTVGSRPLFARQLGMGRADAQGQGWVVATSTLVVLGSSQDMTHDDIRRTIQQFVFGAHLVAQSGFEGIALHVAHRRGCTCTVLIAWPMSSFHRKYATG